MTFLNVAMIGGIFALTIPVLIHLLNRQRPRVVRWGAMHLLEQVVRTQRKRLKFEQILLLLVRAMIPVLLALCMASPVLTGCRHLSGSGRGSVVVLFDNSYSMSAGGANASHVQALRGTIELLGALPDGSDASVIMMAGGATPLLESPTVRIATLVDELNRNSATHGMADVPGALDATGRIIGQMANAKRDVIVISDFQRISWSEEEEAARARAAARLNDGQVTPAITFIHVGREMTDNVAIIEMTLSKLIVGVGQRVSIRANLKNFGDRAYPSLRIALDVNGQRSGVAELTLGPGEDGQVLFTHTFDRPGSHVVRVAADGDNTLTQDNEHLTAVHVLDRVPVLLVDGDPAPPGEPLRGETGFLATALQPFTEGKVELADLIEARVGSVAQFTAESLDRERAVVLANVPQLTDDQLRTLDGYVRGGGGLVIFGGNRVNGEWFNDKLFNGGAGLSPASIRSIRGSVIDSTTHTRIATQPHTHPALTLFNDPRSGSLASGDVWSWFQLEVPADASQVSIIARLENGDPLLIQKRHGQGTVILCATACDADWGNLPARPFYIPLMQQLVSHVASSVEPPRNILSGQPMSALLPRAMVGHRATMTDPAGRRHALTVGDGGLRGVIDFRGARQLGLYTLEFPGGDHPALHFVVNTPRQESDLRQLSRDEVATIARQTGGEMVTSIEAYHELDQRRRHGREIWPWFFWAVLAMCFLEMLLQYRFSSAKAAL